MKRTIIILCILALPMLLGLALETSALNVLSVLREAALLE